MKFIEIPLYRIVPAPHTGIGWVAVERWYEYSGMYLNVSTFHSSDLAQEFISRELEREV